MFGYINPCVKFSGSAECNLLAFTSIKQGRYLHYTHRRCGWACLYISSPSPTRLYKNIYCFPIGSRTWCSVHVVRQKDGLFNRVFMDPHLSVSPAVFIVLSF